MKKYFPLIAIECYLVLTLFILFFGPVEFRIHNKVVFILLIILYHISFISGYLLAVVTENIGRSDLKANFSSKFFYFALTFGVMGIIGAYNNLMLSGTIIPYNFFSDLLRGASTAS